MYDDAYNRCLGEHDPSMALLMLSVMRQASLLGLDTDGLDLGKIRSCLRFRLEFDFDMDLDPYTEGSSDEGNTVNVAHYHLVAPEVILRIPAGAGPFGAVQGSGPLEYRTWDYDLDSWTYYYDGEGHKVPCTGEAHSSGTKNGVLRVTNMSFNLNFFSTDGKVTKPQELDLHLFLNPGLAGAADAAADITTYTGPGAPCLLPVGTVTNWFWMLAFLAAHYGEATDANWGEPYLIEDWAPGTSPGEIGTKVYVRDVPLQTTTGHETTTITIVHAPNGT
jgi:hypothetical protein